MKLAIITDIHDNVWNLEKAIKSINADKDIGAVINCGDLRSPFVIKQLAAIDREQYLVFSAPDLGDNRLPEACRKTGIEFFQDFGELEFEGKRIGFTHKERLARRLKGFDVVFYGHTHEYKAQKLDDGTLLVCCGEIMGRKMQPCYITYDPVTDEVNKINL